MIELRNVSKSYGSQKATNDMTLTLEHPGLYCLLGRNGAGKTTLLKLIAGHHDADAGEILVEGAKVDMLHMPDQVHFIDSNAEQFNDKLKNLLRAAADLEDGFDYEFALSMAERFQLDLRKKYKQLSFGMKVMVNSIMGMASSKKVLILDEPVLGFDAIMRKTFYDLLQESYTEKEKTIIISTHLIDEIARVVEKLIVIDKGQLLLYTDITDMEEKAYCVTGPADIVRQATSGLNIVGETKAGGFITQSVFDNRIDPGDGYSVSQMGLQDFFVTLVGDDKEGV